MESNYQPVPNNSLSDTGIVFSVMVGEFEGPVPTRRANNILKVQKQGIHTKKNGEATRYLVGHFADFASAETTRFRVSEYGMSGAVVVAYKNGIAISVEDAKALLGNR